MSIRAPHGPGCGPSPGQDGAPAWKIGVYWRMSPRAASSLLGPFALGLLLTLPGVQGMPGLVAQEPSPQETRACPDGRISRVFVDNHSVFDPASLPPDPHLRWAYRLANRIHVRTRSSFILNELLLEAGDCHDPELARESARLLREFRFIAWADVYSVPQEDGSRHLVVETRDEWSTKLAGDLRMDGGLRILGVSVTEENVLGRGTLVSGFWREDDERRDVGAALEFPRIRGTNWDLALSGGGTRVGPAWRQALIHPFVGEVGTLAFRQEATARRDLARWTLPDDAPWDAAVIPLETGRIEIAGARRFGSAGRFLLLGAGLSREWLRTGDLSEAEGVRQGTFDGRAPLPPSLSAELLPQLQPREADRLSLLLGVRRIRFEERPGLDAVRGLQDVAIGREILVSVGPSIRASTPSDKGRDLFARGELFLGTTGTPWVFQLHAALEGRHMGGFGGGSGETAPNAVAQPAAPDAWEDVLGEVRAHLYLREPGPLSGHTFLVRAAAAGGWHTRAPFQLALGGPDALRGWAPWSFPGARRVILTVEDRILLPSPFPDLLDLGATLFAETGRVVPGDVPWGTDAGWRGTAGLGLRLGFPAGSGSVVRVDLAFPLGPDAGSRPRFLVEAGDLVGLLGGSASEALDRSRRSGLSPRFIGVSRSPNTP